MFEQLLNELAHRPVAQGISMVDVLDLPEPLGAALRRMIRAGALPLHDFATALNLTIDEARTIGALLAEKGILAVEASDDREPSYTVRLATIRRRQLPANLLKALDEDS
jgi:hypothetical protein